MLLLHILYQYLLLFDLVLPRPVRRQKSQKQKTRKHESKLANKGRNVWEKSGEYEGDIIIKIDHFRNVMIGHYWPNGELPYEISPYFSKISVYMFFLVFQVVKSQNVWENSGKFEGDIILRLSRNVMKDEARYWPNGELPYEIASDFNESEKNTILSSLDYLANKTCVKPVPAREDHKGSIFFSPKPGHGCSSTIGYWKNRNQMIHLDRDLGCLQFGVVLHEVLHALGFWHQHSAKDRDKFIDIQWDNIQLGLQYNFNKASHKTDSFGFAYDYESIMHYSPFAFSRNGKKTILPKRTLRQGVEMGQRTTLSEIDLEKINTMYQCTPAADNARSTADKN